MRLQRPTTSATLNCNVVAYYRKMFKYLFLTLIKEQVALFTLWHKKPWADQATESLACLVAFSVTKIRLLSSTGVWVALWLAAVVQYDRGSLWKRPPIVGPPAVWFPALWDGCFRSGLHLLWRWRYWDQWYGQLYFTKTLLLFVADVILSIFYTTERWC